MPPGRLLLLLNDDTELIEPDSVEVLVGHLQMPDVAMAGAKLLFGDGTLQHGGHVYSGQPNHVCVGWRGDSPGPSPLRPLAVERECSGVTAACALVRKAAFDEVGGFPTELPLSYNDVDFSLKLRRAGHRIVWTPWAVWYHFESRTRDQSGASRGAGVARCPMAGRADRRSVLQPQPRASPARLPRASSVPPTVRQDLVVTAARSIDAAAQQTSLRCCATVSPGRSPPPWWCSPAALAVLIDDRPGHRRPSGVHRSSRSLCWRSPLALTLRRGALLAAGALSIAVTPAALAAVAAGAHGARSPCSRRAAPWPWRGGAGTPSTIAAAAILTTVLGIGGVGSLDAGPAHVADVGSGDQTHRRAVVEQRRLARRDG